MPRVSIVTISFNQGRFLERAIRSVLEQGYEDIEYIVVDPGSSDGSREIIERYKSRISRLILEPDTGPANGLNKGFAAASGDIFGYINADDAFLPGAIGRAVAAFKSRPHADIVYAHSYIVDESGRIIRRSRSVPFTLRRYAYGGVVVMQQSTFFRRQAFESAAGFNEKNRISWDSELLVDCALRGARFALVEDYWSLFAIYAGSLTGSADSAQRHRSDHARIFRVITGLEYDRANKFLFLMARFEKLVRNPLVPVCRIIDKAIGVPRVSFTLPSL
jgi:glycosyltransferase involved in cell wall biosynthesis